MMEQIEELAKSWLAPLLANKDARGPAHEKTFNDPVWGTITFHPWEIALLDTPLVQRLRGVKQLGLAHLVFPSATHDRFSHVCGVVEGAERMMAQIDRNTKFNGGSPARIKDEDRYLIRLAALIHDVGHGPFSHAIESVVAHLFDTELRKLEDVLRRHVPRLGSIQVSEAIAVLTIASESFQELLSRPLMNRVSTAGADEATRFLVTAVLGGSDGSPSGALCALVSSQIDADKLDYMARDAHHAGLPINFDTHRLVSKLEIVEVEERLISPRLQMLSKTIQEFDARRYYEVGIAAGGTGALEQMLIGRTFLFDRLYHHHKVRSADAMAQRLVYYADPEVTQLSLRELYAPLTDEMVIRAFGGLSAETEATFPSTKSSRELASAILNRDLYKRAFAFAGRFIAGLDTDGEVDPDNEQFLSSTLEDDKDAERQRVMEKANLELSELKGRLDAEKEIADLAVKFSQAFPVDEDLHKEGQSLSSHHVIVDLPKSPHPQRITTIAKADDGRLDVPDVFYDPSRWAGVYTTQRRTGYVFAHPTKRKIVALAARVWFLRRFNCVLGEAAERQAKTAGLLELHCYSVLKNANLITSSEMDYLVRPRLLFLPFALNERHVPDVWRQTKPNFAADFNNQFNSILKSGVSALAAMDLSQALRGLFQVIQTFAEDSTFCTSTIEKESDLQLQLRRALRTLRFDVKEGTEQAGGETDLYVTQRVIVENKIIKTPTDDPFSAAPNAGLQGRRYVLSTGQRFVITAVAYQAKTEKGRLAPADCVRVMEVAGAAEPFVEIRLAIRHSDTVPSRAK